MDKYKKLVNVHNEMELEDFESVASNNGPQAKSVVTEQPTTNSQHPGTFNLNQVSR